MKPDRQTSAPHNGLLNSAPANEPIPRGVWTALDVAHYLRLDVGRSDDAAKRAVDRLVELDRLRPCMYTRERMYWPREVERFLHDETEKYGDAGK